jgi:hypothetical protein
MKLREQLSDAGSAHGASPAEPEELELYRPMDRQWCALIAQPEGQSLEYPIVQWVPIGDELTGYVHDGRGRIVRAEHVPGFCGYARTSAVVAALPGMGWTAQFAIDDEPDTIEESRPVLAWLVYDDGTVVPCDADDDGLVYRSTTPANFVRVTPPAQGHPAR